MFKSEPKCAIIWNTYEWSIKNIYDVIMYSRVVDNE